MRSERRYERNSPVQWLVPEGVTSSPSLRITGPSEVLVSDIENPPRFIATPHAVLLLLLLLSPRTICFNYFIYRYNHYYNYYYKHYLFLF